MHAVAVFLSGPHIIPSHHHTRSCHAMHVHPLPSPGAAPPEAHLYFEHLYLHCFVDAVFACMYERCLPCTRNGARGARHCAAAGAD
jgi:hypothetical protein